MALVKATTTRDLRQHFKKYADGVSEYGETLLVTRPNHKNVVMISEDEFNSWQETNYLLSTKANREALQKGINDNKVDKTLTPKEWDKMVKDNG